MAKHSTSGENGNSSAEREKLSRDDILDIASREFARGGYRGTNLNEVSAALGVTRQAIYYYFPKKHDVLYGLFVRFFDQLEQAADKAESVELGPAEAFTAMLAGHIEVVATDPALSSLFTEGHVNLPPELAEPIGARRRAYNHRFEVAYQAGVKAGELNGDLPAKVAINLLLGAGNWVFRWFTPTGKFTPTELARSASRFLAAGYTT